MTQSILFIISPSLDPSLVMQQALTQFLAWAAMSMYLVVGPSGQTMDQEVALSMVRPESEGDCHCNSFIVEHVLIIEIDNLHDKVFKITFFLQR